MATDVVAILGAGNGGQAMAGHLALQGHSVRLYSRNSAKVSVLTAREGIRLSGQASGLGRPHLITDRLDEAVRGAAILMVTTTADAHAELARQVAPFLEHGQCVILNPGRTCGALAFRHGLAAAGCRARVRIAEAQSLVYACRADAPGEVRIIGIKRRVPLAALPGSETCAVLETVRRFYGCFEAAPSVLATSLENIGCIFHPVVVLLNAATIERGTPFLFYQDMTPRAARLVEAVDEERMRVGAAYGLKLVSARDWVVDAYADIGGGTLCERMRNNPAYAQITAPASLETRLLFEDIPTGLVPIAELGRAAGVRTPLMEAVTTLAEGLLGSELLRGARTLSALGLAGLSAGGIRTALQ